ncbi:hypothetical protein AVEN_126932-1 [Araneus ventricosus]|uniref:Uncharacterized protein n=1 Tax=Araneus ventricosus TaxID=182803 RepID=A0A4Y2VR73_ARAVE|nr:hypothetical protein AVEN_126932-1 [Araneus ventricosus]
MIHWHTITLSPPPLLRRFTNQETWFEVQSGGTADEWKFDKFPSSGTMCEAGNRGITKSRRFQFQRWFYKNYTSFKIFNAKFFNQISFQSIKRNRR